MSEVVFTDAPRKILKMPYFSGRGAEEMETRPLKELRKALPSLECAPVVYVDAQSCTKAEWTRVLSIISDTPWVRFCILDPDSTIGDIAAVFHAGAMDYLGKKLLAAAPSTRRRSARLAYAQRLGNSAPAPSTAEDSAHQDGWRDVTPGREHPFAFLFVEADGAEELKLRLEPQNLTASMGTFRDFVERIVMQHGGRLWMWSDFGGLALFPRHGSASSAPLCGLRILLSSIFYDTEESLLPGRLSFRMALSVGSTVYHERETGTIISDAVNSIFHLGRRFAQPAQFVVTADAAEHLPSALKGYFRPAGVFEGQRIFRMLRPSLMATVREASSSGWAAREAGRRSANGRPARSR